jgi:hypothetical protein
MSNATQSKIDQPKPLPGQMIPLPANFPVKWQKAAAAKRFWQFDPMHFPSRCCLWRRRC